MGEMGSDDPSLYSRDCEFDEKGTQKISVSDRDSFVIDMAGLSQLNDKQRTANSRITLQRSLSRKMSNNQRSGEKKTGPTRSDNEKDNGVISSSSPRATPSAKANTPNPPTTVVIAPGTKDQTLNPRPNHHITIVTSNISSNTTSTDKRLALKRSSIWTIDPKKIIFFFATLSSLGTILLIYLTLSIRKLSVDDRSLE